MNICNSVKKIKKLSNCIGLGLAIIFAGQTAKADDLHILPDDNQLALHQGQAHGGRFERHHLHHGMGRAGKGICPQTRKTPKAPKQLMKLKNPVPDNFQNMSEGENLYHYKSQPTSCKVCHGSTGNGMGMMASAGGPMPTNFTCKSTMDQITDGQMFWIIKNGSPNTEMPPYEKFLSDEQIWKLVLYIKTLVNK